GSSQLLSSSPDNSLSCTIAPLTRTATSSSFCWPPCRSTALSNSNSTSEDRLICSMIGGGAGGAVTSGVGAGAGGGGGATATGGGTGASTRRTASHGAIALSGVQSVVFQHRPYGEVHTWFC